MSLDLKAPLRQPLDLACFLIGGLCLTVPSGYALAGLLLWGIGLRRLWSDWGGWIRSARRPGTRPSQTVRWVVGAFFAYGLVQVFVHFHHGNGLRELDDTFPFLLAPLIAFALRGQAVRPTWLAGGFVAGALGCLVVVSWQALVLNIPRPGGFTFVIQFGNLCIWLGLASLCGLALADASDDGRLTPFGLLCILGFLSGMSASILSGTRGGWLALLPALPVLWRVCRAGERLNANRAARWAAIALAVLVCLVVVRSPAHDRIALVFKDWQAWSDHGQTEGSLNERLALWNIALTIIPERPFLGHSRAEYVARRNALVEQRHYADSVRVAGSHVHNDFLQALVRGGMLSFAALSLMYALPLLMCWRSIGDEDPVLRYLAGLIVLLGLSYIVFGLTQTFLNHNSGRMVFAIGMPALVCLWANRIEARGEDGIAGVPTA